MLRSDGSIILRGAGRCAGGQNRNKENNTNGLNTIGRGMCHNWFNASDLAGHSAHETEKKLLMGQADVQKVELEMINKRLSELGK
jgi:hypothetical protein